LYLKPSGTHPALHSFPTRRSSDLDHVDPGFGQGGEDAGGDAGRLRHAEPHHHEGRETGARLDAVDFLPRDLPLERLLQAAARALRAFLRDAETNRVDRKSTRLNSSHV